MKFGVCVSMTIKSVNEAEELEILQVVLWEHYEFFHRNKLADHCQETGRVV